MGTSTVYPTCVHPQWQTVRPTSSTTLAVTVSLSTEDSDEDVFFHMDDVVGEDFTEGPEIELDIEQAPKGPHAPNVVRAQRWTLAHLAARDTNGF